VLKYLDLIIFAFWGVGIAAWFLRRRNNKKAGLNRGHTQELAEKLGLIFDPNGARGSVSVYGQMPDGRAVHLYEEHTKRPRGLMPWQRGMRVASILEVGVETEAFDALNSEQRERARHAQYRHFQNALKEFSEELTATGYSGVTLREGMLRVRGSLMLAGAERLSTLMECLGRMAAEIEARCVAEAKDGQPPKPRPKQVRTTHLADADPVASDASPGSEETWTCTACQSLNPDELRTCQMCSLQRCAVPEPTA